jgi:hypothetical protein
MTPAESAVVLARSNSRASGLTRCDSDVGHGLGEALAQACLVGWVGVGMQERDRDRLDAAGRDPLGEGLDVVVARFGEHRPVLVEALGDLEAQLFGHLGRRLGRQVEAVERAPVLAADGEGIGEARGGDQGDLGQAALDDGVGDRRCAVHQVGDLGPVDADRFERGQHAGQGVAGPAARLGHAHDIAPGSAPRPARRPAIRLAPGPATRTESDHVGEGAADIDAQLPGGHGSNSLVMRPPLYRARRSPASRHRITSATLATRCILERPRGHNFATLPRRGFLYNGARIGTRDGTP